jgi:hypothetical protein
MVGMGYQFLIIRNQLEEWDALGLQVLKKHKTI